MGFDLQDTIAKWAALEKTDKGVPSQAFLDASIAITNIFDELSGMSSVKSDIEGNIAKIQKNVADPLKELEEMIEADIAGCGGDLKKATKEGSTGLALLWLKRALMMVSGLIAAMIKKPDADLKSCVQEGYELGLKKHHNMIMKGVFAAASKMTPARAKFMEALVKGGGGTEAEVMAGLTQISTKFEVIITGIDAYLQAKCIEK